MPNGAEDKSPKSFFCHKVLINSSPPPHLLQVVYLTWLVAMMMLRCQKRQPIKVRIGIIFSGTAAAGNAGRGGWGASDQVGLMFAQMALLNITATAVSCYAQEEEKKEIAENFFSCGMRVMEEKPLPTALGSSFNGGVGSNKSSLLRSVTRFGEISPLWHNFISLWAIFGIVF